MNTRRQFLGAGIAALHDRVRLAAIVTTYRRYSHADVIVGKFLEGCRTEDINFQPRCRVVSLFTEQVGSDDIGNAAAAKHRVRVADTVREALTLGRGELAVDGVLVIGEHGRYPYNSRGQHLYPRRRLFADVAQTFQECARVVPVFIDKHLSYSWADAEWMWQEARRLRIPLMAGSSVPLSWRRPNWTPRPVTRMKTALAVGYGDLDAYGFHTLEMLQCLVENRDHRERGVARVTALRGPVVWESLDRTQSWDLLSAALSRSESGALRTATPEGIRAKVGQPVSFEIQYRDGFLAHMVMLNGLAAEFLTAVQVAGEASPRGVLFRLQDEPPYGHFARLCEAVEQMMLTGRPTYPVERTVLTTGLLAAGFESLEKGKPVETPHLRIEYRA